MKPHDVGDERVQVAMNVLTLSRLSLEEILLAETLHSRFYPTSHTHTQMCPGLI